MRIPIFVLAVVLVGRLAPVSAQSIPAPAETLVTTQVGDLPLIISAPHGGTRAVPGVPVRTGEGLPKLPKGSGFVTGRDTNTDLLAHDIAEAVTEKTGKKPYMVVANFARRYIDANRPADHAYEHPDAGPVYEAYHGKLREYCREVKQEYGRGLLIDVHGQGSRNDTIFRGTRDGLTVTLLRQRFGEAAHAGPNSFFGVLTAEGCTIFPADLKSPEQPGFSGGYIVRSYGSHEAYAIDAIQLEFGGEYRAKDRRKDTAAKVATAIDEFLNRYVIDANR